MDAVALPADRLPPRKMVRITFERMLLPLTLIQTAGGVNGSQNFEQV
jgi:hypothetical protein